MILVRPSISTYLMASLYRAGRWRVRASRVSYMWLSLSKTGKSQVRAMRSPLNGIDNDVDIDNGDEGHGTVLSTSMSREGIQGEDTGDRVGGAGWDHHRQCWIRQGHLDHGQGHLDHRQGHRHDHRHHRYATGCWIAGGCPAEAPRYQANPTARPVGPDHAAAPAPPPGR